MRSNQASMTRLPELADQVIRRNVSNELENLKKAPSWQRESGRSSETLVKYEEFRIVLVRTSVITLNPAIRDQVKTGHRDWPKT